MAYAVLLGQKGTGSAANDYLKLDGTTPMTSDLNMNTHKITNVATPTNSTDATNKSYVDTSTQSLIMSEKIGVNISTIEGKDTGNNIRFRTGTISAEISATNKGVCGFTGRVDVASVSSINAGTWIRFVVPITIQNPQGIAWAKKIAIHIDALWGDSNNIPSTSTGAITYGNYSTTVFGSNNQTNFSPVLYFLPTVGISTTTYLYLSIIMF